MNLARVKTVYENTEPNLTLMAVFCSLAFPFYYIIWTVISPQPYENLSLRLCCAALSIPLLIRKQLPTKLSAYVPLYLVIMLTVCLPFFFCFMMLMNNWNVVWMLSLMTSIFLQILVVSDFKIIFIQSVVGFSSALLAAYFSHAQNHQFFTLSTIQIESLFIIGSTYIFCLFLNLRSKIDHKAKISLAKSFGATIAHEMRNPLNVIHGIIEILQYRLSHLPYQTKSNNNEEYRYITDKVFDEVGDMFLDSLRVIDNANKTIDVLLSSLDKNRISNVNFQFFNISKVIEESLNEYHYSNVNDKKLINYIPEKRDQQCFGNPLLFKYVIINLIKNALCYKNIPEFNITIKLTLEVDHISLVVSDTGPGIENEKLEYIFNDFYTFGKSKGFGLGLSYCYKIITAFNGSIKCHSELGKGTQFNISFPYTSSKKVQMLKSEIIRNKYFYYISDNGKDVNTITKYFNICQCKYLLKTPSDISFPEDNVNKAVSLMNFDVIFVDLNSYVNNTKKFNDLEKQLLVFEGKVIYLFVDENINCFKFNRLIQFELVNKNKLLSNFQLKIEQILFSNNNDEHYYRFKQKMGETILLVDDNASLRLYSGKLLEIEGYNVIYAENGMAALELLQQNKVDLILMDIEMPVLDGLETTIKIRNDDKYHQYRDIPIIGFTGESCGLKLEHVINSGMNDYISKPASKSLLMAKVVAWM